MGASTLITSGIVQPWASATVRWVNVALSPGSSIHLTEVPGLAFSKSLITPLKKSPKSFFRLVVWKVIFPLTSPVSLPDPTFPLSTLQAPAVASPSSEPPERPHPAAVNVSATRQARDPVSLLACIAALLRPGRLVQFTNFDSD